MRILYLVETYNPVLKQIETLIFWSGLSPEELKAHTGDALLIITGVLVLTNNNVFIT